MELKNYEALYALDKKGKVRFFLVTCFKVSPWVEIETKTGLLTGVASAQKKNITKGLRGNTIEEQGIQVADSLYNDKLNEGYKSKNQLLQKGAAMGIDIPFDTPVSEIFKILKITYNTDQRWYPLPMLAEKYAKLKNKLKFPGFVQPKLNGVRCLALFDSDTGEVVLVSRGGKSYNVPHIKEQLKNFFKINSNVVLDGELYHHGKRLQEISGAVRREKDCPDWIEYHVYDCFHPASLKSQIQTGRLESLRMYGIILRQQFNARDVYMVDTRQVNDHEELMQRHNDFVEEGYEGAMFRDANGLYEVSFRSDKLVKVKQFEDEEFEIIGCKVDPNKKVGESFVFELKNNTNDLTFYARPTGSVAEKEYWYANINAFVGKKATVRYQERTADDLPHQAHLRAGDSPALFIEEVDSLK